MVSLARDEEVAEPVRVYLNRLSDLLFVLCRILARDDGGVEVLWLSLIHIFTLFAGLDGAGVNNRIWLCG